MITIKEIAKIVGFSTTTVSNVIHGNTKKVSDDNVAKVKKILKEMNYIPRMGLSSLTNKKSHIICVVIHIQKNYENTILSDPFYGIIVGSLEKSIRDAGYYMMLYTSENLDDIFKMAIAWNVDGLVAISFTYDNYKKICSLTKKPIVAIDLYNEHSNDYVNVGIDDEEGGYQMTKYLIKNGFRKILLLANEDIGVDRQRHLGYIRAFKEFGISLPHNYYFILEDDSEKRKDRLKDLLKFTKKDYAMFFLSDLLASEAMQYFTRNGVSIPEDISIAGFDDNLYAKFITPQLTSVYQDVGLKARMALQTLIKLVNHEKLDETNIILPVRLSIKDTIKKRVDT